MKVLGLDLGTASLGWAVTEWDGDAAEGMPSRVLGCGVRIFPEGFKKTTSGEKSSNAARREKRQQRRQIHRRARRRRKVFSHLCYLTLLPRRDEGTGVDARPTYFSWLDSVLSVGLRETLTFNPALWDLLEAPEGPHERSDKVRLHILAQRAPYLLRALAAQRHVTATELGRALAHLSARRGFQSNRKSPDGTDEKNLSDLKKDRENLAHRLAADGTTLGQHFARLPGQEARIRTRATTRQMYKDEFQAIRRAQQGNPAVTLSDADWKKIETAIFFQRPLRSQLHLKGRCPLIPSQRRCRSARLIAQEFRVRSALLNVRFRLTDGTTLLPTPDHLDAIFQSACAGETLTEARCRKIVGAPKDARWNFEEEGQKSDVKALQFTTLPRILGALEKTMGKKAGLPFWQALSSRQEDFVDNLLSFESERACATYIRNLCGPASSFASPLSEEAVVALAGVAFEEGHLSYSARALRKLIVPLRAWQRLDRPSADGGKSPKELLFPDSGPKLRERLAPVREIFGDVRNPVVMRALTQVRSVVNAIIDRYGLPDAIRVEMSREVKKSPDERGRIQRENREREKVRNKVTEELQSSLPELFGKNPVKRSDIEKHLLWLECGCHCPYTGKPIGLAELFGNTIHVEHIFPFSRTLDDSFANKTLCFSDANAAKGNMTPWERWHDEPSEYAKMLDRVALWPEKNPLLRAWAWGKYEKMRRFREEKKLTIDDFLSRQLIDTQYASKLARRYLQTLYENPGQVGVTHGALTGELRRLIQIHGWLGEKEDGKKARDDHRHHVVDALVISISTPAQIQRLARAASEATEAGERFWKRLGAELAPIGPLFMAAVAQCVISFGHRNRTRGSFHKDTSYGIRHLEGGRVAVLRKRLGSNGEDGAVVSLEEAADQAELALDTAMKAALAAPVRMKMEDGSLALKGPNGKPVKRLRAIERSRPENLVKIIRGDSTTLATNDDNHHGEIWEKNGKWRMAVVSTMVACKKLSEKLPVYGICGDSGEKHVMNLRKGDVLVLEGNSKPEEWRVEGLGTSGQVKLQRILDSRTFPDALTMKTAFQPTAAGLQKARARRRIVDTLGFPLPER